jgi:hypothetical protein
VATWPYAAISGPAVLAAFLALPPQSLPGKYLDGDINLLIPYGVTVLAGASLGLLLALITWGRRGGARPPWGHLAVPPLLVVGVPAVLAVAGGARSRWETGLLFAVVAAGLHVAAGLASARTRAVVWGLLVVVAAGVPVLRQDHWRAEDFEATGLPFVVADVPGIALTATYADKGSIFLEYGRGALNGVITSGACAAGKPCFTLLGGNCLSFGPPYLAEQGPLPTGTVVRSVSAEYLASFPVGSLSLPD